MDTEVIIDQKMLDKPENAKSHAKSKISYCSVCGRTIVQKKGRKRKIYCSDHCANFAKIQKTILKKRKYSLGACPVCIGCGAELSPPGEHGGRPRKRCPECHRINERAKEKMKKQRKKLRLKMLLSQENNQYL
jgi:hypothetical protein